MFLYDRRGIKLYAHDFWLDARRKVPFSFVSHGHSDHLKNHDKILATPPTVQIHALRARQREVIELELGCVYELEESTVELFPAGHILGSAMIRIQRDDVTLLYTGDFKIKPGWTTQPIDIPHADILIMESTFGSPDYVYNQSSDFLVSELFSFIYDCHQESITPIVMGYTLGKAQEAMKILGDAGYKTWVHRSAWEIAAIYRQNGVEFSNCSLWNGQLVRHGEVLIIPPHLFRYRKINSLPSRFRTVLLSGWADSPTGSRFGCDHSIPLSDHADFEELLQFVKTVNPHKVYTTHGFKDFPQHIKNIGYDAEILSYTNQSELF